MCRVVIVTFAAWIKRAHVSVCTLTDIKGNQIKLRDVPKDCGYSVRRNKHGKIQLRFQLHLRCHMSVQARFDSDFIYFLFLIIMNCFTSQIF